MNINFYWSGDNFQFLNRLTLISHILVGHHPVMWLHGHKPKSIYWINDVPEIEIRNANEVFDTTDLIKAGVDIRTTSDKFSYYVLKSVDGYYADTDAIALNIWPDQKIVLATYDKSVINIGVMKIPKDHAVLDECIRTHQPTWGNVKIATKVFRDAGLDYNVPIGMFYPVHCGRNTSTTMNCHGRILDPIDTIWDNGIIPDNCVSYHYWSNKTSKVGIDHTWLDKPGLHKDSLFRKLCEWIFDEGGYQMTNRGK